VPRWQAPPQILAYEPRMAGRRRDCRREGGGATGAWRPRSWLWRGPALDVVLVEGADRTALVIKQLNRSKPGAISLSMTSPSARLSAGREQQSVMLTTLLVIVACVVAGTIVHHTKHERRRW
jgi:hypothetical protein